MKNQINSNQETEILSSFSYKLNTPDGSAYINIDEDSPGKIKRIFFNVGKAGTSVYAWANAIATLVNRLIEEGVELNDLIIIISNITSQSQTRTLNGIECRSGPEALFIALMKYKASIPKNESTYKKATFRKKNHV